MSEPIVTAEYLSDGSKVYAVLWDGLKLDCIDKHRAEHLADVLHDAVLSYSVYN